MVSLFTRRIRLECLIALALLGATGAAAQRDPALPDQCEEKPQLTAVQSLAKKPARIADWPGFAILRARDETTNVSQVLCGASAVHKNWIVTAAHCVGAVNRAGQGRHYIGHRRLEIVIGTEDLGALSADNVFDADAVIQHEKFWRSSDETTSNDIALIKLSKPWTGNIARVGRVPPLSGASLIYRSAGFGATIGAGAYTQTAFRDANGHRYCAFTFRLQEQAMEQVPTARCKAAWNEQARIGLDQICAGRISGGEDTCVGDSGGPLAMMDGATGLPIQVGIVNWGNGICGAARGYGVYARLSAYDEWIAEKTDREFMRTPLADFAMTPEQKRQLEELHALLAPTRKTARLVIRSAVMKQRQDFWMQLFPEVDGKLLLWDLSPDGKLTRLDVGSRDAVERLKLYNLPSLNSGTLRGKGRFILVIAPGGTDNALQERSADDLRRLLDVIRASREAPAKLGSGPLIWGYDVLAYEVE